MKKPDLSKMLQVVKRNAVKHSPEILTGLGIAGMITTAVLAVKATPKALRLMDEEIERQNRELCEVARNSGDDVCTQTDRLSPIETIKITWKCYMPAVALGALSSVCLIRANSVNTRRTAALATAYKISETALTEYRDKVVEVVGEKKEKVIRDKVAEEQIKKHPLKDADIIATNKGETLCLESYAGRYFRMDIDNIQKAENRINLELRNQNYISLNGVYTELGLKHSELGDEVGWSIDSDGYLKLEKSAQLTENDEPCLVISYSTSPRPNYDKYGW